MNLRTNKFSGITRFVLAGVLIPLSFCDYFGQTGWIFAACLGSRRGGVLALIMFVMGAFLVNELGTVTKKPLLLTALMLFDKLVLLSAKPQIACLCAAADGGLFCASLSLILPERKQRLYAMFGAFAGILIGIYRI